MVELMFEKIGDKLAGAMRGLEPSAVTPADAAALVQVMTSIEKLAAGGRLVLLARAAQDQHWRDTGDISAAEHLARHAGTTPAAVRDAIKASEQLASLEDTQAALTRGQLSPQQAAALAGAAAKDPGAETALLETARRESLARLRTECARVTAAATDQAEREEAQHRRRCLRTWTDSDGSLCGRFSLPAVTGAELLAILQPFRDQVFSAARRAGRHDSYDHYAADGLMDMARAADGQRSDAATAGATEPAPAKPRARIQVRCDYFALKRGSVASGEIAEIPGVGPISVNAVRKLFDEAIIDILITKGCDVTTIATNTRYIPQPLRIALAERDQMCFIAGCNRRHRLEHDHLDLFSRSHDTSIGNLHRACARHHNLKTHHGYQFVETPDGWQCLPRQVATVEPGPGP